MDAKQLRAALRDLENVVSRQRKIIDDQWDIIESRSSRPPSKGPQKPEAGKQVSRRHLGSLRKPGSK